MNIQKLQDLINKSVLKSKIMKYETTPMEFKDAELCFIYIHNKDEKITYDIFDISTEIVNIKTPNGTKIEFIHARIDATEICNTMLEFTIKGTPIKIENGVIISSSQINHYYDENRNGVRFSLLPAEKHYYGKTIIKIYDLIKTQIEAINENKVKSNKSRGK